MNEACVNTAVILAGGASSRMGQEKAFLPFGEQTLIEHMLGRLRVIFSTVAIVAKQKSKFQRLQAQVIEDDAEVQCPLIGIVTALKKFPDPFLFVTSCDLPFLSLRLVTYMQRFLEGVDVVVPESSHGIEPLCGFYAKHALPQLEAHLAAGNCTLQHCLRDLSVHVIPFNVVYWFDGSGASFLNVNTPGALERARKQLARSKEQVLHVTD